MGKDLYFYVDDKYWNAISSPEQSSLISNIAFISNEFSSVIYPKSVSLWGSEPNPGIDNDPKITILLEELVKNNGGYFETANGYSKSLLPDSNEREMLAISAEVMYSNVDLLKSFLAHEFQHLISFGRDICSSHSGHSDSGS